MKILGTTAAALILSNGAWGTPFNTSEELMAKCQSGESPYLIWCTGYLQGIADANNARIASENIEPKICIPVDDISNKQLRSSVMEYLESHKEELQLPTGILVSRAYEKAYPCK
jgi:Rap1a immunity proteins